MYNNWKPPLDGNTVRAILRNNKCTQTQLAKEYGRSLTSVNKFIDGHARSDPFWKFFFEKFPEATEYQQVA